MNNKKDSAVSPAIAVILILMLTIVIAAIFAAAAIGFGNSALSGKIVGVTVDSYSSEKDCGINTQIWGGKNYEELVSISAFLGKNPLYVSGTLTDTEIYNPQIGYLYKFSLRQTESDYIFDAKDASLNIVETDMFDASVLARENINIVGKFSDGSEYVIYTGRVSAPQNIGTQGVFLLDGKIKVTGYTLTGNWLGHGILIESLDGAKLENKISVTSYSLTTRGGKTFSGINGIFSKIDVFTKDGKKVYALPLNVDSDWKEIYPYSMGEDNDDKQIDELTGTVSLKVNGILYNLSVTIPARNNILADDDSYLKELTIESPNEIKLTLNKLPVNNRNRYVAYVRYPDGTLERVSNKYPADSSDTPDKVLTGLDITLNENLPGSGVLEVYGLGDLSGNKNGAWYLVGKKIIS